MAVVGMVEAMEEAGKVEVVRVAEMAGEEMVGETVAEAMVERGWRRGRWWGATVAVAKGEEAMELQTKSPP